MYLDQQTLLRLTSCMLHELRQFITATAQAMTDHNEVVVALTYCGGATTFFIRTTSRSPEQAIKIYEMAREWFLEATPQALRHIAKGMLQEDRSLMYNQFLEFKNQREQDALRN